MSANFAKFVESLRRIINLLFCTD